MASIARKSRRAKRREKRKAAANNNNNDETGSVTSTVTNDSTPTTNNNNTTTIKIATAEAVTDRSKHIDVKYHFVKSLCFDGLINVEYLATAHMVADIFTKALLDGIFHKHATRLLGIW